MKEKKKVEALFGSRKVLRKKNRKEKWKEKKIKEK